MPEPLAELFSSRVRAAVLTLVLPRPHLAFSLTDLSRRLGTAGEQPAARVLQADPTRSLARRAGRQCASLSSRSRMAASGAADGADRARHAARGGAARRGRRRAGHRGAWVSGDLTSQSDPVYVVVLGSLGVEEMDGIFDRAESRWFRLWGRVGSSLPISDPPIGRREWLAATPSLDRCATVTASSFARSGGRSARIRTWPKRVVGGSWRPAQVPRLAHHLRGRHDVVQIERGC